MFLLVLFLASLLTALMIKCIENFWHMTRTRSSSIKIINAFLRSNPISLKGLICFPKNQKQHQKEMRKKKRKNFKKKIKVMVKLLPKEVIV